MSLPNLLLHARKTGHVTSWRISSTEIVLINDAEQCVMTPRQASIYLNTVLRYETSVVSRA